MAHYLAQSKDGDSLTFSLDTIHHIVKVMRGKIGDEFEAVFDNKVYAVSIRSISPFKVSIINEILEDRELKGRLVLAFAMLKGGHDELILQKGTELGVSQFIPFLSKRTIIKLPSEKEKQNKVERYRKILKGASEQCRRGRVPLLKEIICLEDLPKEEAKTKLFAYEGVATSGTPFLSLASEDTLLVIGPEGGFSLEEVNYLLAHNFVAVSLGRRILRAETASIAAASNYAAKFEN